MREPWNFTCAWDSTRSECSMLLCGRDSDFSRPVGCTPTPSDPPAIRAPILDGLFDVRRSEIRRQCAFDQRQDFSVRSETQRDELPLTELCNLRAQRVGQQRSQPQSLFKPYHAVLNFQGVLPAPDHGNNYCSDEDHSPEVQEARAPYKHDHAHDP